jgi:uncharacterized protein (DUF2147 family)
MVRILPYLAAASFLAAVSAHAQQPSRLDDIVKRGALRVGMTGDYLPFTYLDKATSKFRGFDVDMAQALGKALGDPGNFVDHLTDRRVADRGEGGKVRIEPCVPNLCGYSVHAKSNQNGQQVLINMKPGKGSKWHGRIHDPNTGSNYDSTIALKGPDLLRVQGCAFGGMFCGGQTWSRLN